MHVLNFKDLVFAIVDRNKDHAKSAKQLGVTENNIRKWLNGQLDPAFNAIQAVLNDLVATGRIIVPQSDKQPVAGVRPGKRSIAPGKPTLAPPTPHSELWESVVEILGDDVQQLPKMAKFLRDQHSLFIRVIPVSSTEKDVTFGMVAHPGAMPQSAAEKAEFDAPEGATPGKPLKRGARPSPAPALALPAPEPEPVKELSKADLVKVATKNGARMSRAICVASSRRMSMTTVTSILGQWKAALPPEIQQLLPRFEAKIDTMIHRGRNELAEAFLASGKEWSLWIDDDMILPIGNPHWFRSRTGAKYKDEFITPAPINRLPSRGKTIVAMPYVEHGGTRQVNSLGFNPKNEGEKKLHADFHQKGPVDKLVEVSWAGFGCVAIHRKVFLDMIEKCPEVTEGVAKGDARKFFSAHEADGPSGEDTSFMKRAKKAGHSCFVDLGTVAAHEGVVAEFP